MLFNEVLPGNLPADQVQNFVSPANKPKAEPTPAQPMTPELKKLYDSITQSMNILRKELSQIQSATPPGKSAMQSLPWFGGGARGFLRKLWYGNSPENPDWSNWQKQQGAAEGSVRKGLTLKEYTILDERIDRNLKNMLSEAMNISAAIDNALRSFEGNIKAAINSYILATGGKPPVEAGEKAAPPNAEAAPPNAEAAPEAPAADAGTNEAGGQYADVPLGPGEEDASQYARWGADALDNRMRNWRGADGEEGYKARLAYFSLLLKDPHAAPPEGMDEKLAKYTMRDFKVMQPDARAALAQKLAQSGT